MAKTVKRGRPQLYPVTASQERRIISLVEQGKSAREIAEKLGVHEYAVLRVRRTLA